MTKKSSNIYFRFPICFLVPCILALVCWVTFQKFADFHKEKYGYSQLEIQCKENLKRISDICLKYNEAHGKFPNSLHEIVGMAAEEHYIFSCSLVDCCSRQMLTTCDDINDVKNTPYITYIYFKRPIDSIRLVCPAEHHPIFAVDSNGKIVYLTDVEWMRIQNKVTRNGSPESAD